MTSSTVDLDLETWFGEKNGKFRFFKDAMETFIVQSYENKFPHTVDTEQKDDEKKSVVHSVAKSHVSEISQHTSVSQSTSSRRSESTVKSSASSARMKIEAKKAALEAKSVLLKEKQNLELKEWRVKQMKEQLEIKTEIAVADAQCEVYKQFEESPEIKLQSLKLENGTDQIGDTEIQKTEPKLQEKKTKGLNPAARSFIPSDKPMTDMTNKNSVPNTVESRTDLLEMMLKHQRLSGLPECRVPVFNGDPLEFLTFMRTFEHCIEQKTDSPRDRLFYLEQFTKGEPNELVCSCMHIADSKEGYDRAKSLLQRKFGNEYKVSSAYIDKALNWPQIRPEDCASLNSYSLFLLECGNSMENMNYMRELEHPKNMKLMVSKLPYKLRERWRTTSFYLQERQGRKVTFADLVNFVEEQSLILSDPLYGKISDDTSKSVDRSKHVPSSKPKFPNKRYNLATNVKETNSPDKRTQDKCIYCEQDHKLDLCSKLQKREYQEKLEYLSSKSLCFGCLNSGHFSKECQNRLHCQVCGRRHATVLHSDFPVKLPQSNRSESTKPKRIFNNRINVEQSASDIGAGNSDVTDVCMPIVPVRVRMQNSDRFIETYAFLDNGSSATFCTERLIDDLGAPSKKSRIMLSTMAQDKVTDTYTVKGLMVSDILGKQYVHLPQVYTQSNIPVSKDDVADPACLRKWSYLQEVVLPVINADVQLLIGNNVPTALEPLQVIKSYNNGPYAVRTLLGWTVNGPMNSCDSAEKDWCSERISVFRTNVTADLQRQLVDQFNYDFSERIGDDKPEMSIEEKQFMQRVSDVEFKDGHYQLPLPFRDPSNINMPDNRIAAEQRAENLKRKFQKNPTFHEHYKTFISDLLEKGYAQKIPDESITRDDNRRWYLPHHGVYHPQKPRKVRVVFDCSACFKGTSLNHQLLQGPDLTNSLIGVLLRFRQEQIAVMADIKAMFLQVKVTPRDFDMLRFLWWPNGDVRQDMEEYQMTVHLFGATSSPSCANFALKQTAVDNKDSFSEDVLQTLERNFYVDDLLKSLSDEEETRTFAEDVTRLCALGGFSLTKWISNCPSVLESIPPENRAEGVKNLDLDDSLTIERALGLQWNVNNDQFTFNVAVKDKPLTRRGILSIVSSVYDPLGCVGPFVLQAKSILQNLIKLKCSWDDEIPSQQLQCWNKWLGEVTELDKVAVDRCVKSKDLNEDVSCQIHHFSDASESGYGTVSYLRVVDVHGHVHCAFLIGKSRVAPLKQITIPRLELTAATVAVKVDRLCRKELEIPIERSCFWTDSMSVLRYINNQTSRFQTFVANRLAIIHDSSEPSQWRYVETKLNPADIASRGASVGKLIDSDWFPGPEFLRKSESEWPETPKLDGIPNYDLEIKKKSFSTKLYSENSPSSVDSDPISRLFHYFSDWYKLRKAVAWILRVRNTLLHKVQGKVVKCRSLTLNDIHEAENVVIKHVQRDSFMKEINTLQSSGEIQKGSSLSKLDPFMREGVLRVGGRLNRLTMPDSTNNPVVLPKDNHISTMIIRKVHENLGHVGRNHVLSHLNTKYWIVSANSAVRKVLRSCVRCCRQRSVADQKMSDLPIDRITPDDPPFSYVGVDYFGPFEVKRGRSLVKRYGVLFTCLTVRAIHIEIAHSLDTDSCVNALRRFVSRRGQVKLLRSDNGTNFVGTEKELKSAIAEWNKAQIQDSMMQKNVQWTFNPPTGSHHGGAWERQIRTVRKILASVVKQQTMDDESLLTLMCEIEYIVNSRPISRISDDPNDLEALTPNHLLLMKRNPVLPPGVFRPGDVYSRRRWKQVQYMADLFWGRWTKEYLPLLQTRQKWTKIRRNMRVGDVVLLVDNSVPRSVWSMGRIVNLYPDSKGLVRSVDVKTQTNTLRRPISKLCLLLESECTEL